MTSKVQRQQTIARIISEHDVTSQPMLLELLEEEGIEATQATVSRDLEDLGAVKVRVRKGESAYASQISHPIASRRKTNYAACCRSGLQKWNTATRWWSFARRLGARTSWHPPSTARA